MGAFQQLPPLPGEDRCSDCAAPGPAHSLAQLVGRYLSGEPQQLDGRGALVRQHRLGGKGLSYR